MLTLPYQVFYVITEKRHFVLKSVVPMLVSGPLCQGKHCNISLVAHHGCEAFIVPLFYA